MTNNILRLDELFLLQTIILTCLIYNLIGHRLGFEGNLSILSQISLLPELQIMKKRLKR